MSRAVAFRPSARRASRLLQAAIGAVLLAGVATRNLSVVVNATLSLAVTFLPALLARDFDLHLDAWPVLVLTLTLFLHTIGMLGLYDGVWWYDHITHTLSAMLVAGVGYTTVRALDRHSDAVRVPSRFLAVFIVLFTLAAGVLWEVLEFAAREFAIALSLDPVLVQYGLEDSLVDLVFDTVGALVVALFGTSRFDALADRLAEWLGRRRSGRRGG
ncbi:MAG: hypothetical protein ABEJ05_04710 [Haloglomus sp.]